MKIKLPILICFTMLSGCTLRFPSTSTPIPTTLPTFTAPPVIPGTSTLIFTETPSLPPVGFTPTSTPPFIPTSTVSSYCADPQVIVVIDSLKTSMLTANGSLLSSLVNPTGGMDVRFFRTGNVLNYSQLQAKFLFETTYQANWGAHPASGKIIRGAFHDVVVPELVKSFNQPYVLYCNDLQHGGATYEPNWQYKGNFYVVYFAGTEPYGNLDWHSWVIGIDYVNAKPYIYAFTQFFWEP